MIQRPRTCALAVAAVLTLFSTSAWAQFKEQQTVSLASTTISEVMAANPADLTPRLLRNAHAVAIVPQLLKGGFIVGGRFGQGVVLVRTADGWSRPVFVSVTGGSFGFQAGVQSTELVLVFKTQRSVEGFLNGRGKLSIGANGSLALGNLGRHAEAGGGVGLKAAYAAYSKNRGLFAGAALSGTGIAIAHAANAAFYGRSIGPTEILVSRDLVMPQSSAAAADQLRAQLAKVSTPPGSSTSQPTQVEPEPGLIPAVSHRATTNNDKPTAQPTANANPKGWKKPVKTTTTDSSPGFPFP